MLVGDIDGPGHAAPVLLGHRAVDVGMIEIDAARLLHGKVVFVSRRFPRT